jgi:hypothetical protein
MCKSQLSAHVIQHVCMYVCMYVQASTVEIQISAHWNSIGLSVTASVIGQQYFSTAFVSLRFRLWGGGGGDHDFQKCDLNFFFTFKI